MPTRGSIPGRLGAFILGHILCSVLYFFFAFLNFRQAGPASSTIAVVQIYLLPAALYLLAGCLFSRLRRWPGPGRKTAFLSVLFPTLCAWGWVAASAGVGIFASLAGIPALEGAGSWMLFSTVYWAPASALFVLLSLLYSLGGLPWLWLVCVPLAGLLPPLLFFLGSLLPHRFRRPQPPALPEGGTPRMRHTGSVHGRFGGFAAGHFTLSVLGFGGWLLLSGAWGLLYFPVYVYVLMLLYVPAGWVVSSLRRWPAPDLKTGVKAVLYPALCAWIWAFGGLWLFSSGGALPSVGYLGLQILLSTFLLASPSALFVLMTGLAFLDGAAPWLWLPQVILAGLLPPLLFFLGSLLPRASQEGCSHESEKSIGAPDSPVRAPHSGPAADDSPSGDHPAGIERFVAANQAALEEIAADCLRGSQTAARYKGVEIEGVFPGEHRIVQFFSGGFGLAPASTYCGFYYSEDGVPAAYQNVDVPLTPAGENRWRWSDGTDNGGVTRRITEHWFSYRAWF